MATEKLVGLELLKELVPLFRISCAIGHHGPKNGAKGQAASLVMPNLALVEH